MNAMALELQQLFNIQKESPYVSAGLPINLSLAGRGIKGEGYLKTPHVSAEIFIRYKLKK